MMGENFSIRSLILPLPASSSITKYVPEPSYASTSRSRTDLVSWSLSPSGEPLSRLSVSTNLEKVAAAVLAGIRGRPRTDPATHPLHIRAVTLADAGHAWHEQLGNGPVKRRSWQSHGMRNEVHIRLKCLSRLIQRVHFGMKPQNVQTAWRACSVKPDG